MKKNYTISESETMTRTTHVTAHTRNQRLNDPSSKRDDVKQSTYKILDVSFDSMGSDVTADVDENLNIDYPNGFGGALKEMNCTKVTDKEAMKLLNVTDDNYEGEDTAQDAIHNLQTDNTYNGSSAISHDLNFGMKEINGRKYISFSTHRGGDVRGNYGPAELWDITDLDNGATGDPFGDVTVLLHPQVYIQVKIKGKNVAYTWDGDRFDETDSTDPKPPSDLYDKITAQLQKKAKP